MIDSWDGVSFSVITALLLWGIVVILYSMIRYHPINLMQPPKLTFLLPFASFLALCWLVVLRAVPLDWLTGLFVFVLLLMLAATSERVGRK